VALDWPAFGDALWKVSDQLGIRPEWQLPVLALESGFNPAILNSGGCVGLNQFCPGTYELYVNVPVNEYQTWSASQQLSGPIFAYWKSALGQGPIGSSTKLMVSQLRAALLKSMPSLDSVVYAAPSSGYRGNCHVFDPGCKKGYFTVRDIANVMVQQAQRADVRDALARVYAMRPGEYPREQVYGDDYTDFSRVRPPATPPSGATAVFGVALLAVIAAVAADEARARFA
jgi:hypothetical protein